MKIRMASALLVFLFLSGMLSIAQAANLPRQHDSGFFLRLSAGLGSARTEIDAADVEDDPVGFDVEASGLSGDANFAIGVIVSPNLALHATLLGWAVTEPDFEIGGIDVDSEDVSMSMSGFGAGLTYYLDPSNVYFSGSIAAATMNLEFHEDNATTSLESDTGVALQGMVGKEWWVGSRWGLGVAVDASFHSIPTETDESLKGTNFGVRFSATYN